MVLVYEQKNLLIGLNSTEANSKYLLELNVSVAF